MTVTRAVLMQRASRAVGARIGTIGTATARTAVLNGLINSLGEDESFKGWRLIMPEATAEADKEKFVDDWEDATGTAHFIDRATDTDLTGEIYILMPPEGGYSLNELRDAANQAFRETNRTYRHTLPLYPGQRVVPLTALTWLKGDGDVDQVWTGDNPSLLHNPDFGLWHNGDSLAPDSWTLDGSLATVARAANGLRSPYGATLTRVTNDATLYQSVTPAYLQHITRSTNAGLPEVNGLAIVVTSTASRARVGIYNGSSTTYSSYAAGTSGLPEVLTVSYQTTATDTDLRLVLSVDSGDAAATWHYADLVAQDDFPDALRDFGGSAYHEWLTGKTPRNIGGIPVVEFTAPPSGKQLITYSRRPFPELDADTDEVEDQHARALEAGLVAKLLQNRKPNQDRTRLDVVMDEEQRIWNRLTNNFIDLPVPPPPYRAEIWSA